MTCSESMTQQRRRDGLVRRQPRLGLQPDGTPSTLKSIGSLKGDPERRAAREARYAAEHPSTVKVDNSRVLPRRQRRAAKGRGYHGGFLTARRKPSRPSGVALASPTSLRGRASACRW